MFKRATLNLENWNWAIPYISFLVIGVVFAAVIIWVFRLKKPYLDKVSRLPLDDNNDDA